MIAFKSNRTLKFLSLLLLLTFFIYHLNSALYTHLHKLEDGTIVVHAHPYIPQDDTGKQHNHSKEELIILEIFSHLFVFIFFILFILILNQARKSFDFVFIDFRRLTASSFCNRAPPHMV